MEHITTTKNFLDLFYKIESQKLQEYIERENLSEKCDKAITLLKGKISSKRNFTFNPPSFHNRGVVAVADFFIEGPIHLIPSDPSVRGLRSYLGPLFPNADSINVYLYPKQDRIDTGVQIAVGYLPDVKKGVKVPSFQEMMENDLLLAQIERKIRKDFPDSEHSSKFKDFLSSFDTKIKKEREEESARLISQVLSIAKDVENHILNAVELDFDVDYSPQTETVLEIKCPLPHLNEDVLKENRLLKVIQNNLESSLPLRIGLRLEHTPKKEYFVFVKIHR